MTKKTFLRLFTILLFAFAFALTSTAKGKEKAPKYVFYLIGDGMGINHVRATELFNQATGKGPETLNFTTFPVFTAITTHSASSLVTDSAAAGTALATGVKTANGRIGMDKKGDTPLSNICEWAHDAGFAVGVTTSVGVNHATPGAFTAHEKVRSNYNTIAEQLVVSESFDYLAGSGCLVSKEVKRSSKYYEEKFRENGATVLYGPEQFKQAASVKSRLVCFPVTPAHDLPYAIDFQEGDTKLADLVGAGIDYLYAKSSKKGFFFMIEGGSIDHAAHNNDAACDFYEVNDFAQAIDVVLDFYNKHADETLIVVTADHETGGLMIGNGKSVNLSLIDCQTMSENNLTNLFRQTFNIKKGVCSEVPEWEAVKEFFKQNLGMWGKVEVDEATDKRFKELYEQTFFKGEEDVVSLYAVNSKIVSDAIDYVNRKAGICWAHGSHTGSLVGLWAKGAGANEIATCRDNTNIPVKISQLAGYKK